ncbi:MAG: class I SAM-dependent methyltransferase [Spirochaetaceae bacterium]|jgi:hypothetical protein|nr:class I SAM-dependent methyltransferase [Spirochaetaceae bacterium]
MDYTADTISAADAKFEAQKIAFAPLAFQAVRALLELGILRAIAGAGDAGLTCEEAAGRTGVSAYGAGVLLEAALHLRVVRLLPGASAPSAERFVLGKIGWFILEDDMAQVNINFVGDVCYRGAAELAESVKTGKPAGLSVFGTQWRTIYEALSALPEGARKSWFAFDHFYSDTAFSAALPIVFARKPKTLFDIGGNTAKWAIRCCRYDPDVEVTIIDLPGQTAEAARNAADAGFSDRIRLYSCDALDPGAEFPAGAQAVWMSQFLDCFSPPEITRISAKISGSIGPETDVFALEPFWDMQKFEASAYSLTAASLYFTCIANGNSKMYRSGELTAAVEQGGLELKTAHHGIGSLDYSLLRFRKF